MTFDEILRTISKSPDGCWFWLGAHTKSGYSNVRYQGRQQVLHRVMWENENGPVPAGLQLDHLCRNRGCCNPAHVEPVTQAENMRRGVGFVGENTRKTSCPQGHPYDLVDGRGYRDCSICKAARRRRAYEATSIAVKPRAVERTHCPSGHPYDEANTYLRGNGHRGCRECRRRQRREHYEAKERRP